MNVRLSTGPGGKQIVNIISNGNEPLSTSQSGSELQTDSSTTAVKPVVFRLVTQSQPQVWTVGPMLGTPVVGTTLTSFVIPAALTAPKVEVNPVDPSHPHRARRYGNGLRQFAEDVLRKVERKGVTTYNEVADELVSDMRRTNERFMPHCEEKNIRRRVYDALNVLLAIKVITKDKKLLRWSGMPATYADQRARLEKQKSELQKRVNEKRQELNELIVQQVAFANLIERNHAMESTTEPTHVHSEIVKLRLPFIVVNTRQQTSVDCWMSANRDTYVFNFNERFEMHDDVEVLKRIGLAVGLESGKCHGADLERALKLVGVNLRPYIIEMAVRNHLDVLSRSVSSSAGAGVSSSAENSSTHQNDSRVDSVVISNTLQDVRNTRVVSSFNMPESSADGIDQSSNDESDVEYESRSISEDSDVEPTV